MDISNGYKYQGYRDSFYSQSTIRSKRCDLFVQRKGSRCIGCQTYRRTLRKVLNRRKSSPKVSTPKKDWTKCKTSNKNLTEHQKLHKIKQLKDITSQLQLENARLRREIANKIRSEGVCLSEKESKDLSELMQSCEWDVKKSHPDESSYQRLFWKEQFKYSQLNNNRGMRWHPSIIKWCIYLKSKSATTYDTLRNSGFVKLPSERILFDYTNANAKGVGFLEGNIDMLIDETEGYTDHQRIVGLLQDEVKIKSDLVYDRHTGELIGFVNLGSINNNLNDLKNECDCLAKYVLVVMVRGISLTLKFPLAHFATNGVTSDQLFCILWEAVEICEVDVGLKVLFITSDGASSNRRFIRLHDIIK
ncbi:uncharacterized protein LOC127839989 [Dreissena polymorpha]|uniref:uncharacterized protein LOC127839989 n=1 Tax=Dreissena polymorpha TaxID=45954 RepID=UPI0022649B41|nr:uncharacterized protein LOC127839989 [Dreissena polymorpha]